MSARGGGGRLLGMLQIFLISGTLPSFSTSLNIPSGSPLTGYPCPSQHCKAQLGPPLALCTQTEAGHQDGSCAALGLGCPSTSLYLSPKCWSHLGVQWRSPSSGLVWDHFCDPSPGPGSPSQSLRETEITECRRVLRPRTVTCLRPCSLVGEVGAQVR